MGAGQSIEVDEAKLKQIGDAHFTAEQVSAIVAVFMEKNKKAKPVSRKGFLKVMKKCAEKFPDDPAFKDEHRFNYLYTLFDVNHDNKVGVEELVSGLTILSEGSLEEKAKLTFQAIDLDNNGFLSKSEIKSHFEKLMGLASKCLEVSMIESMEQQGQRPSGFAIRLVLKPVMFALRKGLEDAVIKEVFDADTNKDGKISLEEWLAAVNTNTCIEGLVCPEKFIDEALKDLDTA